MSGRICFCSGIWDVSAGRRAVRYGVGFGEFWIADSAPGRGGVLFLEESIDASEETEADENENHRAQKSSTETKASGQKPETAFVLNQGGSSEVCQGSRYSKISFSFDQDEKGSMSPQQQRAIEAFNVRGYYRGGMMGLGDSRPITTAIGSGLLSAGGVIAAIPGGQLPGAIIAAVGALTSLVGSLFAPDLTKIQASNIVNQIEAQTLKPMRASWQALPASQKTQTIQAAYLEVFDAAWKSVVQGCSNPALGTAGGACISDRQQGACHYTVDGQTPGVPPNCGNWFVWYRSPIADDPEVHPDAVTGSFTTADGSSVGGSIDAATSQISQTLGVSPLWIGVGLIAAALLLGGE